MPHLVNVQYDYHIKLLQIATLKCLTIRTHKNHYFFIWDKWEINGFWCPKYSCTIECSQNLKMLYICIYVSTFVDHFFYSQLLISRTPIFQSMLLDQRIQFTELRHIYYFYLNFNSLYLKILISQSKFSGSRKFTEDIRSLGRLLTLRYHRVDCIHV